MFRLAIAFHSSARLAGAIITALLMTAGFSLMEYDDPLVMSARQVSTDLLSVANVIAAVLLIIAVRRGLKPLWAVILFGIPLLHSITLCAFNINPIVRRIVSVILP